MLRKLCILGIVLLCTKAKAQTYQWVDYFDSVNVFIYEMQTASNNDIVMAGGFMNTVDFDPGPGTASYSATGMFNSDAFIARYTSAGALLWVKVTGSGTTEDYLHMKMDSNGDIIVGGSFYGSYDMDPGPGVSMATLNGNSQCDAVLIRFTGSGTFVWGTSFGGTRYDGIGDIAIQPNGNIIITGTFTDECDLQPGPGVTYVYATGGNLDGDIFCSCFSSSGNFTWGWTIGSTATDGASVCTDNSGYIYLLSAVNGTIDVDPSAAQHMVTTTSGKSFLVKYTPAGNFDWAETLDYGITKLCISPQQTLFLSGNYVGTIDADPGPGVATLPWVGGYEVGIICLDTAGSYLRSGSITGPEHQMISDAGVDASGHFYFCGQFEDPADFDPGAGTTTLTPATWRDAYFVCLDAQLDLMSAVHIPCVGGEGAGLTVTHDSNGDFIVHGRFSGTADFDPGPGSYTITSTSANMSTFIAKYSGPTGVNDAQNNNHFVVYPNPCTNNIRFTSTTPLNETGATLFDVSGRVVQTFYHLSGSEFNLPLKEDISPGLYTLVFSEGSSLKVVVEQH